MLLSSCCFLFFFASKPFDLYNPQAKWLIEYYFVVNLDLLLLCREFQVLCYLILPIFIRIKTNLSTTGVHLGLIRKLAPPTI